MSWAAEEFSSLDLGDQRLNNRAVKLLTDLGDNSTGSIPSACGSWNETKAAYRFFDNPRVTEEEVLRSHKEATLERMSQENVVLLIQDTTELDYSGQKCNQGTGFLNSEARLGLYLHPTIAVTPERLCLGVTDSYHWTRKKLKNKTKAEKNRENLKIPIEEKESYRWVNCYLESCEIAEHYPDKTIVSVGDREYDIYEVFLEAHNKKVNAQPYAEILMRSSSDRRLQNADNKLDTHKLWSKTRNSDIIGHIEFDLPARDNNLARRVKQEVRVARVTLAPPTSKSNRSRGYPPVEVTAILSSEIAPPEGTEPVEWLLLSSIVASTDQKAFELIKWYLCRWEIEIYFKVLKSGCKVEELQLETSKRATSCIALYMIIAWRILFITRLGRTCPDMPCDVIFHETEWKSVYAVKNKNQPPEKPPSLAQMIKMIASLGGFLNRKNDGYPGPKVMWIGMQKMRSFASAWEIFENIHERKTYG